MQRQADNLKIDDGSRGALITPVAVLSHRNWIRASGWREKTRAAWDEFFDERDIVICPQMATTAFMHDHQPFLQRTLPVDQVQRPYFEQLFWAGLAISAYLPRTVVSTGLSAGGLPIGFQAIGGPYCDFETIKFTQLLGE